MRDDQLLPCCPTDPLLLMVRDVAAMLRLSERTVWRRAAAGELPAPLRIGNSVRWRRDEIIAWVEAGCPRCEIGDRRPRRK